MVIGIRKIYLCAVGILLILAIAFAISYVCLKQKDVKHEHGIFVELPEKNWSEERDILG